MNNNLQLSNFTDVLIGDDIIDDSQPLSLPSSNKTEAEENLLNNLNEPKNKRPERYTGQKGQFRSREEIDEKYRHIFSYPYFNLVQSRIIDDALYSDKSLVVCAPTGSGKTVVFEMAIVQLLMEIEDKNLNQDFKIIYMAPVKALCTERLTEWYPKFNRLGILCIEVTGDTDVEFPQLKPYRVIITTPEKWDMLTRRWKDHSSLVEVVKLFLIDEVHILNDQVRGPVLEAVVSRMKTIESSAKSDHRIAKLQRQYHNTVDSSSLESPAPRIRFIAVSATVSNPEDVAKWLGTDDQPAVFYKFGEECRPVKLKLVVEGYPCSEGSSIFKFDIVLNYKLWPIIQRYHNGKPTLIFCNTRKSVALTAETLSREITVGFSDEQKARLTALASTIKNKKIQSLVLCGVGCHHAGLLYEERVNIENAFRNSDLPILITTTTLAMGVNLPAHLVIIKNTHQYINGAYQEYSISTILQMVGRAGRPQFDTEATAVIMTRLSDKARYQSLVGGSEPLQSYLHKRLAENLNSEAALKTVTDVAQCVQWVNSTFLSVRAARDPRRYLGLPQNACQQLISKKIEELCVKAMNGLATSGLITMDEASCIESTDAGRLMSLYYIDVETMKTIIKIKGTESLEQLLWLVCESHELSDMHLRVDERRCLNTLNRNNAAATIRFPMKGKINTRQMKLNCIIQAVLGCLPIPDPSLNQEAMKIMRIADRVCLVAYVTSSKVMSENPKCYSAVLNGVLLTKCISAHLWENSPYLSKQLKGIGPTFSSLLASAGKVSFMLLEESHPRDLERIMNKGPPAGNVIRKQISLLPKYRLTMTPLNQQAVRIELLLLNQSFLMENMEHLTAGTNHRFYLIVGDSENNLLYYSAFKDTDLLSVYDGCITCDVTRKQCNEHKVMAHCISSNFVGIDNNCEYVFQDLASTFSVINNTNNNFHETPRESGIETKDVGASLKRKRKVNNEFQSVQSKERKKRDTNLIKQFENLKQSFRITSNNIKEDLNETTELTNMIVKNINPFINKDLYSIPAPAQEQTENLHEKNCIDVITETFEPEDHVDDVEIMHILNEIEGEINNNKQVKASGLLKKTPVTSMIQNKVETSNKILPHCDIKQKDNFSPLRNKNENLRRKCLKSNYSFIDSIEKKACLDNDDENVNNNTDAGFSSTIKDYVNQFLEKVQHRDQDKGTLYLMIDSKNDQSIINNTDSSTNIESHVKMYETDKNSAVNIDKRPSEHNNISNITHTIHNSCHTSRIKYNNSKEHDEKGAAKHYNEYSHKYSMASILKDYENIKNNEFQIEFNMGTENKSDANEPKNIRNSLTPIPYKANQIVPFASSVNNPLSSSSMYFPRDNEESIQRDKNKLNHSFFIERPILQSDPIINPDIFPLNSENCINNYILEIAQPKQNNLRSSNSVYASDPLNYQENIFDNNVAKNIDHSHQNRNEKYDINKFSFSATKINTSTKVLPERQIHIVSRVKVDLDITEVKTKRDNLNESSEGYTSFEDNTLREWKKDTKPSQITTNTTMNTANTSKGINIPEMKDTEESNEDHIDAPEDTKTNLDTSTELDINAEICPRNKIVNVNDILKKYQTKLNASKIDTSATTLGCNEDTNERTKYVIKPKRQYKISDLHKINIPLPESLSSVISDTKIVPDIKKTIDTNNLTPKLDSIKEIKNTLPPITDNNNLNIEPNNFTSPKSSDLNDFIIETNDDCLRYSPPSLIDIDSNQKDFDVSQAMLNPKTLLQSVQSDEEIIPPPPEFSDNTYSPTFDNTMNISYDYSSDIADAEYNIGESDNNMNITGPEDVETWSLSIEDPSDHATGYSSYQSDTFPAQSSYSSSQRQTKLNRFKFTRRNIFKLKNNCMKYASK